MCSTKNSLRKSAKSVDEKNEYFDTSALLGTGKLGTKLIIAQHKLREQTDFYFCDTRGNRFFEPEAFMSRLNKFLDHRINEI